MAKITYGGKVYFKDGTNFYLVSGCKTQKEARTKTNEKANAKTHLYYKLNGVDFGERGKCLSMAEIYGGIEKITIIKTTTEEIG